MNDEKQYRAVVDDEDEVDVKEAKCGWFRIRPLCLQKFRTPGWALFWLCWAGGMQGLIVNGFVNVVITTIERRFGFRSTKTGLIAGGYDFASFLLLIPVSYFGGRPGASKIRYIGIGVLILGLGSLVFASPHYFAGRYALASDRDEQPCRRNLLVANLTDTTTTVTSECSEDGDGPRLEPHSDLYLAVFVLGQLLHGAGAAPFYTLGVTYLDENVPKQMSPVYLGIFYTMAIIGPACGYVIGGELLKIYVDFLTVDHEAIGLTRDNNLWIGAWWIGFVVAALVCVVVSIPILAFPSKLPGSEELAKTKVSEAHVKNSSKEPRAENEYSKARHIPQALKELLGNPAFFMLNLAGASEGLMISGFAAFLPKLIENQFSITASYAALIMGLITVPAGGGGTFLGGYIIKHWDMSCTRIIQMCFSMCFLCLIFTTGFLFDCPNLPFAGVVPPKYSSDSRQVSLIDDCNADCGCSTSNFNPICGIDGITYYSPCHAGCLHSSFHDGTKVYSNCSCIESSTSRSSLYQDKDIFYEAINTTCPSNCQYLGIFLVMMLLMMFVSFGCSMPALAATLRVVRDDQRSFALGIQWIKVRLLGTIPSPLIFGGIMDVTCILWHDTCDRRGSCLVHDNYYMSRYIFMLAFIGKLCSGIFFFLAWWWYVPPGSGKVVPAEEKKAERY